MPDCSIRTMRRGEIALAIELAAREGWNPGLHDAHCFAEADAQGFLIAEVDGRPAGCISAVRYGERFGFIGLYIVVPANRGRGIGRMLWDGGMARLAGQVFGRDGGPAQQA
jgi:GNAT superfamily N-acetyltransferase